MAQDERTFAVAGATGRLGLPVALRLLALGHRVRLLSRDPAGRTWPGRAEPVFADYDDPRSLRAALDGVDAVFATGSAHRAGPEGEARHGRALADVVRSSGVSHLVFVSGAGADRPTGVPVFDSKHAIERRIAELGIAATILAPVYFMENAFNPWNLPALRAARFPLPLPESRALQQVAIDDLASFAVLALEGPREFAGRRIELVSDELSGSEAAATLSRVTGTPFAFERLPLDGFPPPLRRLFQWLDEVGTSADLEAVRRDHPEIGWHSFESWAAAQEWPSTTSS